MILNVREGKKTNAIETGNPRSLKNKAPLTYLSGNMTKKLKKGTVTFPENKKNKSKK